MNEQTLSLRLQRVGAAVPLGARLADIGSDHAYLPVALMLKDKISFAVAGEVVKGPYESAHKQVLKNGLSEKIIVRLADGLAAIQPEDQITAITIAGMGGTLIRSILENGLISQQLSGKERLILQPNVGEPGLRFWLMKNKYQIIHEEIIEEHQKIYELIVAEKAATEPTYSEQEIFFGPFLLKEKNSVFQKKWQREMQQRKRVLTQLKQAEELPKEKIQEITQQLQWIQEVLEQ